MSTVLLCAIEFPSLPGGQGYPTVRAEWDKHDGYRVTGGGQPARHYPSARAAISAACGRAARLGADLYPTETTI